jgi:hypothetical protein
LAWTATTDDFADAVRECAALPDAGSPTDAEIFRVADKEIQTRFVPFMRDLRENFWVATTTETLVVGTADYRIPSDAQGGTLRMVMIVDSAGVERNLQQVPIQHDARWNQNGRPVAFCIIGNKLRLFPAPDTAETLRLLYYRRPSKLVAVADCWTFFSHEGSGVLHIPYADIADFTADSFDLVQAEPPFDLLADASTVSVAIESTAINITSVAGTTITIDPEAPTWEPVYGDTVSKGGTDYTVVSWEEPLNEIVLASTGITAGAATHLHATLTVATVDSSAIADGDYVCEHMETCVVQLPAELYYALISATAAQLLNTDGDQAGFMREMAQCERIMAQSRSILAPRVDGAPRVIIGTNSPLRSGRRRSGRGWDMS